MAGLDPATQGRQLRGWMLRKPNDHWFSARIVELTLGGRVAFACPAMTIILRVSAERTAVVQGRVPFL